MLKRLKYVILMLVFFTILGCGFIKVSNDLPQFIKDRSAMKVTFTSSPFDLRFDIGDYIVYINSKIFANMKDGTKQAFKNFERNNFIKNIIKGK